MPPYLFLQADYDGLLSEIDQLKSQIRAIKAQVGVSTSQSSETWHDNIEHEELMRKHDLYMTHLNEKERIRAHAQIVQIDQASNTIQLGSLVGYDDEDGASHTVRIGSYRQFGNRPGAISYEAPLAQALLGKKLGQNIEFTIGVRTKSLTITKIVCTSE